MILVVGGQGAGKRAYVKSLGYADDDFGTDCRDNRPVLFDLHRLLKENPDGAEGIFVDLLRKEVVVCNEIGCGIVPMDAADRAWRDAVGMMCARLAERAERVVRVCCGIPLCIKGGGA